MTDYLRKSPPPIWTAAAQQRVAETPPTPREVELAARLADETAARIRAEAAMDAAYEIGQQCASQRDALLAELHGMRAGLHPDGSGRYDAFLVEKRKRKEYQESLGQALFDLEQVLRILRKIGGYMSPEDQQVVWVAAQRCK